jgi:hypothetical protein
MLNHFVIDVLITLSSDEREEFGIFLRSPFFNRGANRDRLLALTELLFKAHDRHKIDQLEKSVIFQHLFPGKQVVESKVDKLMSELKRQVQIFLTVQKYNAPEQEMQQMLDFSTELRQRGLVARYHQTIERIKKEVEVQPFETLQQYHFKHQLALEEHEMSAMVNKFKGDINLPNAIWNLDNYYLALKTELLNRLLLQRKVVVLSPEAMAVADEKWEVPSAHAQQNALNALIREIHLLLKESNPEVNRFFHLLQTLQQNESKFSPENIAAFYTYLRNFCSFLLDAGKLEFLPVLHEIQRDNLQRGYFYFDGKITPNACLSITQTAIGVGAVNWAKTFVESHKELIIDENETRDFFRLNYAFCLFAEQKFDEALEIIPFGSSYSLYHLFARRLELKIYYELDSELLSYKIDAFKMFISRAGNKVLSENIHELYVNFINFLRQLSLSTNSFDPVRSEKLTKRISEKKLVAERAWLLDKARELGSRKK